MALLRVRSIKNVALLMEDGAFVFSPNFILIYFCVHFPFGHYVTTYIMLVSDGHMTTARTDHHVFSSVVL